MSGPARQVERARAPPRRRSRPQLGLASASPSPTGRAPPAWKPASAGAITLHRRRRPPRAKAVRSASWRATIALQRALQRRPVQRAAAGAAPRGCGRCCSPAPAGPGTRAAAARTTAAARPSRAAGIDRRQLRQPARRRPPRARAKSASTWAARTARPAAPPPPAPAAPARSPARPAASARPARRSCPAAPTRSTPSTSAQISASASSVASAAPRSPRAAYASPSGAGSALRSSLPFGVSGSALQPHVRRRHHVLRQPLGAGARAAPPPRPPRRPPRTPPAAARPARPRAPAPPPRARPGAPRSRASISPSSMRKPRTFTWWSVRPRNSSVPSASHRAQVARAVQPRARLAAERVGDEALRRQLRPAQVAARHARAADVQLARHADRHRLARARPARRRACSRSAGRSARPRAPSLGSRTPRAVDGTSSPRWGRTGCSSAPPAAARAAAAPAPPGSASPPHDHARRPRSRSHAGALQRAAAAATATRCSRADLARAGSLHQAAGSRRAVRRAPAPRVRPRSSGQNSSHTDDVEAERRVDCSTAVARRRAPSVACVHGQRLTTPRCAHHHALGPAGGARGVDDVRQVLRRQPAARRVRRRLRRPTPPRPRPARRTGTPGAAKRSAQRRLRQQHRRRAVGQHVAQPLGRVRRVQRHVGAAGLEHRQQRHHHLQAALHADPHPRVRAHAQRAEVVRQPVGPRVQLRVGQRLVLEDHAPPRRACAPPAPRTARGRTRSARILARPSRFHSSSTRARSASGSTSMLPDGAARARVSSASTSRSSAVCITAHTRAASTGAAHLRRQREALAQVVHRQRQRVVRPLLRRECPARPRRGCRAVAASASRPPLWR